MNARDQAIRELRRARPRSRFLRFSVGALLAITIAAWIHGGFSFGELLTPRSKRNVSRFLEEIKPYPLQGRDWDWGVAAEWVGATLEDKGATAVGSTVAMSVAAIVLASLLAALASLAAARNLACPEPFLPSAARPGALRVWLWRLVVAGTRLFLIFLRAVPEYVWAFLLLNLMGVGPWPAVAALALHNAGILGKLYAEVTENMEPATPRALRGLGATRLQIAVAAVFPINLGRYLLYFFYRWETCVREASVLGLLGFISLGWYIQQGRAAMRYDEMVLFVLLGVVIILCGDLISTLARLAVRRSG
jgi:phosphonate transport system permease protein